MDAWDAATLSGAETESSAQKNRQDKQFTWALQCLNGYSGSGEIISHLENFSVIDHESLTAHLIHAIRCGKCPAESKPQFIRWCKRQIDKQADELIPFALAQRLKDETGRLTVADVMKIASLHGRVKKCGLFPKTVQTGDVAEVHIGKGKVLRVPAVPDCDDPAKNFLPILECLWPFHERNGMIFKHSTRQSYTTGRWRSYRLPLHALYAAFQYGVWTGEPVHAKDGDFLDWTRDNISRTANEPNSEEYQKAQRRFEDGTPGFGGGFLPLNEGIDGQPLLPLSSACDVVGGAYAWDAQKAKPKGAGPAQDSDPISAWYRAGISRRKKKEK